MLVPSARGAKILIIDDESDVAEMLCTILRKDGYVAEKTTDPFRAVSFFQKFQPDLVILDLIMPGRSGAEILAQLRAIAPPETHLPIVVVTGDPNIETRAQVLRDGASDFVAKPYDVNEIRARVSNLLETRTLYLQLAAKQVELEKSLADLTVANTSLCAEVAGREVAERASHQAKDVAVRANAIKSEFLSRASHELRTPMNHILGFAQLLETDALTPEQLENVQQILTSGRRLLQLIDRILAISKTEPSDPLALEEAPGALSHQPDFFMTPPRTLSTHDD